MRRKKIFATHSRSVAETKSKQDSIHTSRAVRHSAFYNQLQLVVKGYLRKLLTNKTFGELVERVLKMLTRRRKRMTRRPIRPPISSIGIRNEIQDTRTNKPEHKRYPNRNDKVLKAILKMKVFSFFVEKCKTSEKTELTGGEEVGDDVGGDMPGQHLQV